MKKKIYFLSILFCVSNQFLSSQIIQTIRGTVIDKETEHPIEGVTVAVKRDSVILGAASTDSRGAFHIEKIPVGRVDVAVSYVGYKNVFIPNVLVASGKENVLNVEVETAVKSLKEVEIHGRRKGETINEMAVLSARAFSVEETERYAGSRGDPQRMASNYAGVSGTDDSRNDLVIRGNAPFGVLYRVDNIAIPNPNHFAGEGTTGGSVAVLNNRMLATSDFFTGAFPAEFGNGVAGVFDIRLKNGNNERHEFTGQVGMLGAEAFGEGPFGKNSRASYIFNYRYATLEALVKMGVDIGTTAIPKYQDLQFKFNFPMKNGDDLSVFGNGGLSMINFITSTDKKPNNNDIYASKDQDENFRAGLGMLGVTYTHLVNDHEYSKISLGVSTQYSRDNFTRIIRHIDSSSENFMVDTMYHKEDYKFFNTRYTLSFLRNNKINSRNVIRYGLVTEMYQPTYRYNILHEPSYYPDLTSPQWVTEENTRGEVHFLFQPYVQWKYAISEKLTSVLGLHGQYLTLSNSWSVEPRFSLKWQFKQNQSLAFGTGIYSQMLPVYQYFVQDALGNQYNKHLDFYRSFHAVLGYDVFFKRDIRIKVEAYYQLLWNIPVDTFSSSYNVLDEGTGFDLFFAKKLVNKGLGRNTGVELTLEKFFTHNWFIMFTGSVYDSRLQGSNKQYYSSIFNGQYIVNLLGTKEFRWGHKRQNTIGIGGKITFGGGQRYTPYDTTLSKTQEIPVVVDAQRNRSQFSPYFRFDVKLNYRCNRGRFTHEVGIDLVNVTGYKNVLRLEYVNPQEPARKVYQLGFLPLFYYRLDFWVGKSK